MTDRELLELAAKAAGYKHTQWSPMRHPLVEWGICTLDGLWNPLTDDGDALRLAVKLEMRITNENNKIVSAEFYYGETEHYFAAELVVDDPYAATRRAIVRAAAEIGKEMK